MLIRKLLIFGTVLLAIFCFNSAANACSCSGSPPVDIEYGRATNVAVLKVQSLETYPAGEKGLDGSPIKYAKLTVEKVFKGKFKVGQELTFSQGICCICSWVFDEQDVGKSFLFYLSGDDKEDKVWSASICSRSRSVKNAAADLLYLEKLTKVRDKTRLSGTLNKMLESPENEDRYSFFQIPNHKIHVVGKNKTVELSTDENGGYEIYDLPPGKYKIYPDKLDGFTFPNSGKPFREVEIKAKSHTEVDFYFEIDNAVSGKVVDANGKPLENVCLDLILSKNETSKNYSKSSCTGKNGEFEIRAIPDGSYFLAINNDGEIRIYEPFGTFYYPNVKRKEEALEITVRPNYFLRDLTITPPEMLETITLSGVLFYKDGTPVKNETVEFISEKEIFRTFDGKPGKDETDYTDENGRFSFKIWKGQSGVLRSSVFSFIGKYKNCPEIDELVKQKGESVQEIGTPDFVIDGTKDLMEIKLIFPFPKCEEAK